MTYKHIEDYGLIGDLHTVAMVARDGSIDYLCLPDFDSPTVFAALLDADDGGTFEIRPTGTEQRLKQIYLPDTNVLLTRFLSTEGVAEITDFMPVGEMRHAHAIVRRVTCVRGRLRFRLRCAPRFDYARSKHQAFGGDGDVRFVPEGDGNGGKVLRLQTPIPLDVENGDATGEFELGPGDRLDFVLELIAPDRSSPAARPQWVNRAYQHTVQYWRDWAECCRYEGRWREMVTRSALALKLLTSERYGSIAAAATLGLPELVGGERNWDYRYCWIRDGSLTAMTLLQLGLTEEPRRFVEWITERYREGAGDGRLQIMYGIDGRHDLTEELLPNLSGYRGSAPVRAGNAAYDQLQLDIYGELLYFVDLYDQRVQPVSHELWGHLRESVNWVSDNWAIPDEGIWEVRGGRQQFLYGRLMCWVALNRAIAIAERRSRPAPVERWREVRDRIYDNLHEEFWDERRGTFVQHRGSTTVDASVLLMPITGFVSHHDPRWASTMRAVDEDLVDGVLVYRYRTGDAASDGLTGTEGSFCMCSFWFIECLTRAGDLERARLSFEKVHSYSNHLGLYAEEMDGAGWYLGNFPQAFSHLGLVNAAMSLDEALSSAPKTSLTVPVPE